VKVFPLRTTRIQKGAAPAKTVALELVVVPPSVTRSAKVIPFALVTKAVAWGEPLVRS
jgi:hypothetical protein